MRFEIGSSSFDRLCGIAVRVLGYRSGGPASIPGTTRKKKSNGSLTVSTQPREYNWGATWWKSSGSCLENREYGCRYPSRSPCGTLYPQKLAITLPTSGGRSVGIVRSRTQTMEFVLLLVLHSLNWRNGNNTGRSSLILYHMPVWGLNLKVCHCHLSMSSVVYSLKGWYSKFPIMWHLGKWCVLVMWNERNC
jgi:hypothetical protein